MNVSSRRLENSTAEWVHLALGESSERKGRDGIRERREELRVNVHTGRQLPVDHLRLGP